MSKLKFRKNYQGGGSYFAQGETKQYGIYRQDQRWVLEIKELVTTAGVTHALGQPVIAQDTDDTKAVLVQLANAYEAVGDDYKPHEDGYRTRMMKALDVVYAAERAAAVTI